MPIYSYKCRECGLVFLENMPISKRDEPTPCASCKGKLMRIVEFGSIAFKGSGFYSTDK